MNKKLQNLLESVIPFLVLGIAVALAVGLFIMLSYVLVWGLVIGGILWLITFVKNYFFPKPDPIITPRKTNGRIIEHDNTKD